MRFRKLTAYLTLLGLASQVAQPVFANDSKKNERKLRKILEATRTSYSDVVKLSYEETVRTHYLLRLFDYLDLFQFLLTSQEKQLAHAQELIEKWRPIFASSTEDISYKLRKSALYEVQFGEFLRVLSGIESDFQSISSSWDNQCSPEALSSFYQRLNPETLFSPTSFGMVNPALPQCDFQMGFSVSGDGVSAVAHKCEGDKYKAGASAVAGAIGYGLKTGVFSSSSALGGGSLALGGAAAGAGAGLVVYAIWSFFQSSAYVKAFQTQVKLVDHIRNEQEDAVAKTTASAHDLIKKVCRETLPSFVRNKADLAIQRNRTIRNAIENIRTEFLDNQIALNGRQTETWSSLRSGYLPILSSTLVNTFNVRLEDLGTSSRQVHEYLRTRVKPLLSALQTSENLERRMTAENEIWNVLIEGDVQFSPEAPEGTHWGLLSQSIIRNVFPGAR